MNVLLNVPYSSHKVVHLTAVPVVLYTNIDQTLVNSIHGLLNCEIGG